MSGLRGRLIITVVVAAALGAAAAAWAGVQQSTASLIEVTQRHHTEDLAERITRAAPSVPYPPDRGALDQLRIAAGEDSLVRSGDVVVGDGIFDSGAQEVPDELRRAVGAQAESEEPRVLTQRVDIGGGPWLVIGSPVMFTAPDGTQTDSGIEVYAARDLSAVQDQVNGLVRGAATTTLVALPLAILLALLASQGVLRPVARLRMTAQRLADGDREARTEPAGVGELAQLTRTVNDMAASLQASMETLEVMEEGARRFAADVSHELRTPLTTLTAAVEVLHDVLTRTSGPESVHDAGASDEAEARESAQLALVETRRLMELVEGIMEIARFDAGTAHLRWDDTDLYELVSSCIRARGWSDVVVTPTAPDQSDATVAADRRRIDVVVANLIGNALKHGGAPVRVHIERTDDGATVRVVDSGPGIPEDVLPHVFSRFYKADAARVRTPGSGLGLAIARENVLLHGGTIAAENQPGGGAAFTVWLPRAPDYSARTIDQEQST
ncbi:sensor histidine kinase [Microbacterium halotolerans]|uniref:sensor histidine kinase n=1 Tax=Microbacterium halotolerans TaxID=246613 RepID=UPI001969743E|nr:HAMP domain-containing sensor histidine kinase [Microbacterium halotolerans]